MIREFMEFLKVKSDKLEGLMYHYTSIDGLLGITKDKYPTLYFSKINVRY